MSSGIINTIKKTAMDAYEASKPVAVFFGQVTSLDPVKIRMGNNTLTEEFLVINCHLSLGANVTLLRCQGGQKFVALGTTIQNT